MLANYWTEIAVAVFMAIGGYFTKRLIDGKAESADVKALIRQLEDHVTSCNERNEEVTFQLGKISDKLQTTSEHVAEIRGKLSA